MSWADRLLGLWAGGSTRQVVDPLQALHQQRTAQAERLAAAAAAAPDSGPETHLRELAAVASQQAAELARVLHEQDAMPQAPPAVSLNGAARNHWARLVAALEAGRAGRTSLLRATPRLLELDPSLADLLQAIARSADHELAVLRALIARADPQALN